MINFDDYPILRERMADLKELSKDNSINETPCYLTESSIRAVDFDKVKTAYVNHLGLSEETTVCLALTHYTFYKMLF